MTIGRRTFNTKTHFYIMGILNITPDSFSDGGQWNGMDDALRHAGDMIADGADILDIGGESTRPGYAVISDNEEIDRVVPVLEAIRKRFDVPLSIDTYKSAVAQAAVDAGASLINDIWGLRHDPKMVEVIAKSGVTCCLTHNRREIDYVDFLADMLSDMSECVKLAESSGINRDKIILDPGIGFGKTYEMNLSAINNVNRLCALGYPVLLGASRKSVIGHALNLPVTERCEGTIATTVIGIMRGCSFVRVHDVKETKRAVLMAEAVLGAQSHG